jgi:hypothetical protein
MQAPSSVDQYAEDEPINEGGTMDEMEEDLSY